MHLKKSKSLALEHNKEPNAKYTDILRDVKQHESEYMHEYGKMVKAKDNDEFFDTSKLEKVGKEFDELEIRLKANTLVTKKFVSKMTLTVTWTCIKLSVKQREEGLKPNSNQRFRYRIVK